jgi:hypothetical protein
MRNGARLIRGGESSELDAALQLVAAAVVVLLLPPPLPLPPPLLMILMLLLPLLTLLQRPPLNRPSLRLRRLIASSRSSEFTSK